MGYTLQTTIDGPVDVTVEQIVAAFRGGAYPEAEVRWFGECLVAGTRLFGFRTAGVSGRMGHETGWFRYGGDVGPDQFNFAGLGATGGVPGLSFVVKRADGTVDRMASIQRGVLAVLAHEGCYRWGDKANWPADLRQHHNASTRYADVMASGHAGTCRVWGDFSNGRWAWTRAIPGGSLDNGYAVGIVQGANHVLSMPGGVKEDPAMVANPLNIRGLEDVRHLMARNPNGGNAGRRALADIQGEVVHFNGPDVPDASVRSDRSFVIDIIGPYHAQKDFGSGHIGDGVMYHVAVLRDGTKLWLRDFEMGLWHCGNTEWNEHAISIYVHLGINQRATDRQLQALREVVDDIRAAVGDGRDKVKGHMELSSTNCPGTLMADFVRPYRAGVDAPIVLPPEVVPAVPDPQPDPWRFDEAAKNYAREWNGGQRTSAGC